MDRKQRHALPERIWRQGMEVLESQLEGLAENQALAEEKGMSHLLYFHDAEHITMVSLMDEMGGFTVDILVSDLQLPR